MRRFIGVLRASPLSPAEQRLVSQRLTREEADLFWAQDPVDQRHAYEVAERVAVAAAEPDVVVAALLHDVGKRHSAVGVIGRSLATMLDAIGAPMPADWRRYRQHGELGAADLAAIGASPLAVAFAKGELSDDLVDAATWRALLDADNT